MLLVSSYLQYSTKNAHPHLDRGVEAFGDCETGAVATGLSIWISVLAGTLMYMSFIFYKINIRQQI